MSPKAPPVCRRGRASWRPSPTRRRSGGFRSSSGRRAARGTCGVAEDAVGSASQHQSGRHDGALQFLDEITGRSDRHADVGTRCRGRRGRRRGRRWGGCRCGGEGEAGDGGVVEDARRWETLGLLIAGQCGGRHGAEHAVGSTADLGDAGSDQRPLEDLHVLATGSGLHARERGVRSGGERRGGGRRCPRLALR